MGKASENKNIKRNKLLDTAFQLFTTKGVSETSVADITTKADVGKGTFYLYFKNKQDLEAKLISHRASAILRQAASKLEQYPDSISIEDKFVIITNDILEQFVSNPTMLKFIYKNLSWGIFRNVLRTEADEDPEVERFSFNHIFDPVRDQFIEPDLMLYTIIELVSSTCYNIILWSDPVQLDVYKLFLAKNIRSIIENHTKIK